MNVREAAIRELEDLPEDRLEQVVDFVRFLKQQHQREGFEAAVLSEHVLRKDWLRPEEDEAWQHL